jgi:outer membrane protein
MHRTKKTAVLVFFLWNILLFGQGKKWTLEECVDYAIQNNISIKQSSLDAQTSLLSKKDAFGKFLPTINAQASHSWNIGLNQNITTGLLENQTTQFTSAGLNVGIDIFKGLQNINQLRKSNLTIIAAKYQLTKMQEDISLNVANAYLQILFSKENLKVQQQQQVYDSGQLVRSEELVEAGVIPRGDLLDIQATLAADNQKIIVAENTLLLAKLSLAQLLQIKDFETFDIANSDLEAPESTILLQQPKDILEIAKQTRAELKIAETNVQIAEKDLKIARGGFLPSLQGFYNFNTRAAYSDRIVGFQTNTTNPTSIIGFVEGTNQNVLQPNFSTILGKPDAVFNQFSNNKGQSFGISLNMPILNGFFTKNNVARSKIALERSKIMLEQEKLSLERTIFTSYIDTQGAQKSYEAALIALKARENALQYAKERYEIGLMNVFDYNQVQTVFSNAQSEVLRTKYDYIFRTKILEFYFGIPINNKK